MKNKQKYLKPPPPGNSSILGGQLLTHFWSFKASPTTASPNLGHPNPPGVREQRTVVGQMIRIGAVADGTSGPDRCHSFLRFGGPRGGFPPIFLRKRGAFFRRRKRVVGL